MGTEIVVGIDGSDGSQDAIRWAATEAAMRQSDLAVVNAFERLTGGPGGPYTLAHSDAEAVVLAAAAQVHAMAPGLPTRTQLVQGHAAAALIASAGEGLIVVGNRGRGGFASLTLGSVSQQIALHAAGPVVVVRGRPGGLTGPVVVGADGSKASQEAVATGFAEAGLRHTSLVAIRVYPLARSPWGEDIAASVEDRDERQEVERQLLDEQIHPWRDKFPDVPVETVAIAGHASEVLTGVSNTAALIVVGATGHGGFAATVLGSTPIHLIHHANSPVFIARTAGSVAASQSTA